MKVIGFIKGKLFFYRSECEKSLLDVVKSEQSSVEVGNGIEWL